MSLYSPPPPLGSAHHPWSAGNNGPLALDRPQQRIIAFVLVLLMVLTRGHHFASLHHLPEASWTAFFLAGVYVRPVAYFPVFCGLAFMLDTIAITWGGVSNFCISRAYAMLLPAYGALWLAGRWYAGRCRMTPSTLVHLFFALLAGASAAELFSSGGFYLLSGRFEPDLMEFIGRELKYFPPYLGAMLLYVGFASLLHIGLAPYRRGRIDRT